MLFRALYYPYPMQPEINTCITGCPEPGTPALDDTSAPFDSFICTAQIELKHGGKAKRFTKGAVAIFPRLLLPLKSNHEKRKHFNHHKEERSSVPSSVGTLTSAMNYDCT